MMRAPLLLILLWSYTTLSYAWTFSPLSRRDWIGSATIGAWVASAPAEALDELPESLRPFTNLAPGLVTTKTGTDLKTTNLPLTDLAKRLEHDLVFGSNETGGYFLTGDLSQDIFRDDCVFSDPTNSVNDLARYQSALRILFDPDTSVVQLLGSLQIDGRTLTGRIRSRGYLQLPWHPYVTAYESKIIYTIDDDGLIARQDQSWSKPADTALRETFTPSLFTPGPKSTLSKPTNEPAVVTRLFEQINGRRPTEYSEDERIEIASMIDEICAQSWDWKTSELPGTWILTYLQPGPTGIGIDRRIPFPEFDFNDNYQIFTEDSVVNIGELFGPLANVKVSGGLKEADERVKTTPKGFVANIDAGKLCIASSNNCIPLPITGEGIFDGMYLGPRLRIGQNVNGGGARVVQVRIN